MGSDGTVSVPGANLSPRGAVAALVWAIVGFVVVAQVLYGTAGALLDGDPVLDPAFWAYWVIFEIVGTFLLVLALTLVVSLASSLGLTRVSRTLLWILGQDRDQ